MVCLGIGVWTERHAGRCEMPIAIGQIARIVHGRP
jgi:hypothetical protein